MIVVESVKDLQKQVTGYHDEGKRIAFVPTMGNLHGGHLRLVREARRHGDVVAVSIYVNPMQFGPNGDLDVYPRTPEEDKRALKVLDTDLLFLPRDQDMYPRGLKAQTFVEVPGLSDILCGASRPGHFCGVATVVNRLLNLVTADVGVFGKKDYQQLSVIRRMVEDLAIPTEIVGVETVREADGLAMSSRNNYLTPVERAIAPRMYATLKNLSSQLLDNGGIPANIEKHAVESLEAVGFKPDYVSIRRQQDLSIPTAEDRRLVILAAAWLGKTRLIENIELDLNRAG